MTKVVGWKTLPYPEKDKHNLYHSVLLDMICNKLTDLLENSFLSTSTFTIKDLKVIDIKLFHT